MAQCGKCKKFLPPGFVKDTNPETGEKYPGPICVFCAKNVKELKYKDGRESVTKKEVMKEYEMFMRRIKDENSILVKEKSNKIIENPYR